MRVRVQSDTFDPGDALRNFSAKLSSAGAGAVVTFSGIVRSDAGRLTAMQIEHYPGMTEASIGAIVQDAITRWALIDALVIHRFGLLKVGEPIMMVATAAGHRAQAFAAADFLMDYLKSRAPFWKKELRSEGDAWVAATDADEAALRRW